MVVSQACEVYELLVLVEGFRRCFSVSKLSVVRGFAEKPNT